MTYESMKATEKTHICSECDGELVTIWDAERSCHRLCCGSNHSHNGFKRRLSVTQVIKRGKLDEIHGPGAQKDLEERAERSRIALSLLPKEDTGSKRVLTITEIGGLVEWGNIVGVNARLGHVCLYHSKPYVTIDGYYYLNNKRASPYRISTLPMSEEQRVEYQLKEGDIGFIASVHFARPLEVTVGVGIVGKEEIEEESTKTPGQFRSPVVHSHPQRMAEKRAEWQLLRKLIPLEEKRKGD